MLMEVVNMFTAKQAEKEVRILRKIHSNKIDLINAIISRFSISVIYDDISHIGNGIKSYISWSRKDNKDNITICIDDSCTMEENVFFVAHEIGHYVKHFLVNVDTVTSDIAAYSLETKNDKREIEADEFAKKLLLDRRKLREFYNNLSVKNSVEISEEFFIPMDILKEILKKESLKVII